MGCPESPPPSPSPPPPPIQQQQQPPRLQKAPQPLPKQQQRHHYTTTSTIKTIAITTTTTPNNNNHNNANTCYSCLIFQPNRPTLLEVKMERWRISISGTMLLRWEGKFNPPMEVTFDVKNRHSKNNRHSIRITPLWTMDF